MSPSKSKNKLRLALPKGWLIREDRWSIRDILKQARIGEFYTEGMDTLFRSNDSELEVMVIRPRDIPRFLRFNEFDIGITGQDLINEEFCTFDEKSDYAITDLSCSYVDLALITTPEKEKELKNILEGKENRDYPNHLRLKTVYPQIANSYLRNKKRNINSIFDVMKVEGVAEDYLVNGIADVILEAIATGESVRKRGLVVLEKVLASTARLYPTQCNSPPNKKFRIGYNWEDEKIQEVKRRIEEVVNDIDNYIQLDIKLKNTVNCEEDVENSWFLENSMGRYFKRHLSGFIHRGYPSEIQSGKLIMTKSDLVEMRNFLESGKRGFTFPASQGDLRILECSAYNLKSLAAYCLTFPDLNREEMKEFYTKYPCFDSSQLRPEHRPQATIFTFENGQFQVNPQYAHLFTAG